MGRRELRRGSRGREVAALQELLREGGYYDGEIDGRYGPATAAAMTEFQARNGLAADGICGQRTWRLIDAGWEEEVAGPAAPAPEYDFSTVAGTIAAIRAECQRQGLNLPSQQAYVVATVEWETGGTFRPIAERGPKAYFQRYEGRSDLGNAYPGDGYTFRGRGYPQLTGRANYARYARIIGKDLVNNPDLALDRETSLFILVHGMKTGTFTGVKLGDYVNAGRTDFRNARRCVNGLDRADTIAALAKKHLQDSSV